ncbi:MAG: beta-ketoacyl synthase chain length factor [Bacteroidales bacterium]
MAFINGIGLISPQNTLDPGAFLPEILDYTADYLKCVEPVYRSFIDPIQSRRMSRLIKMGISSAKMCMADAQCQMPDAIITGTGLGSVEDTEKILGEITREERFLNPTPFIQSTYNTISSQVAIQLKCHKYNSTYVHRTFSFESGLIDGLMQIEEGIAVNILAGGIDEMTMNHLQITRRTGHWKMNPVNNMTLRNTQSSGALAGEGAAFFVISAERQPATYAELTDVATCINFDNSFNPDKFIPSFLGKHGISASDVDLVILGVNGDCDYDPLYLHFADRFFPGKALGWFKHLCGEYHTATGFGLYAAANILKNGNVPEVLQLNGIIPAKIDNILIYNQYRNVNHSFMLLRK